MPGRGGEPGLLGLRCRAEQCAAVAHRDDTVALAVLASRVSAKSRCRISTSIEYAIDRDRPAGDVECDSHPAGEADDTQARAKIVSAGATLGEGFEAEAIREYPVGIRPRAGRSGSRRDKVVEQK